MAQLGRGAAVDPILEIRSQQELRNQYKHGDGVITKTQIIVVWEASFGSEIRPGERIIVKMVQNGNVKKQARNHRLFLAE